VLKSDGLPYTIFTPYSRAWKATSLPDILPIPGHFPAIREDIQGISIAEISNELSVSEFRPGEVEAIHRLETFTHGENAPISRYHGLRNFLDQEGTSKLSPYFHFGMLSARQAAHAAVEAMRSLPVETGRKGAETWLNELIWREFYGQILYHFPNVHRESFRADLRKIAWVNDEEDFAAWRQGKTGVPVVDAAMRQLVTTGWMHNRARMVVASYLTKDLLIDWRWGERWFLENLLDADVASNNGGWQWSAGTGTDAAPYFRIFNPTSQGIKFDPQGDYVKQWVSELKDVPVEFIHKPWEMPLEVQVQSRCRIGKDYPAPRVDHAFARERVLNAFKQAKA
jgi:deoxyribodipyrimidine photo-lyase